MISEINNLKTLYEELYNQLPKKFEQDIYPFFIQVGRKYNKSNKKCLFVGKSINGWVTNSRNVDELFDENNDNRIVNRNDQMEWVHNLEGPNGCYNTKISAFWRVIKGISSKLHDEDWYNYIAWSNLYKLCPEKGNPNARLQKIQRSTCIKILTEETKILKPDCIVFLTSSWEKFYLESIGIDFERNNNKSWSDYKTYFQIHDNRLIVQSLHPQGKNESSHIEAIVEIIQERLNKT
jgi:hypothetical protein